MEKLFHLDFFSEVIIMDPLDNAYQKLAQYCLSFIDGRLWDKVIVRFDTYSGMTSAKQYYVKDETQHKKGGFENNPDAMWDGLEAADFLKSDILQKTGSRIWGLTFTLYPTGKFNIDYDYNKPDDYEESDEQVTGAQANESLFKLGFRGKSESNE
jgi:hypothetical protein